MIVALIFMVCLVAFLMFATMAVAFGGDEAGVGCVSILLFLAFLASLYATHEVWRAVP